MQLNPAAATAGYRLSVHDTLASTNGEALALARGGEHGPLWIAAIRQTAGRGRRGNAWVSDPGNLYATLLLVDPAPAERGPELSFVTALAVHDAIAECAPGLRVKLALKWPNDLLCGGAKIAGILIEGEGIGGALAVAIGIGVNCRHHPADTAYPATDLAARGRRRVGRSFVLGLVRGDAAAARAMAPGAGFAAIRADWIARAAGIGGDMRVRLAGRELEGRGEAIDDQGRLLLRLPDGSLHAIAAGDVFPLADGGDGPRVLMAQITPQTELVFAPLGGVGEIGMNLLDLRLRRREAAKWLIVDCGVSFASEEHLPGVDLILPDIRYLIEQRKNIVGLVLTHGHEDHMGALIDLWPRLKVPIYATPFTAALFEAAPRPSRARRKFPSRSSRSAAIDARAVRNRLHQCRPFDPGIECARHPHAGGHGAAHRRLEDRSDALDRRADRLSQTDRARRCRCVGADRRFHQCRS